MKLLVVDASVAIKWFCRNELNADLAVQVLVDIKNNPDHFAVPELFFNEMLHVLCRLFSDSEEIKKYMGILTKLGLARIGNGGVLLERAIEFSKKYSLSGYDAIYAATAFEIKGEWLTADKKAHQKISDLNISRVLG